MGTLPISAADDTTGGTEDFELSRMSFSSAEGAEWLREDSDFCMGRRLDGRTAVSSVARSGKSALARDVAVVVVGDGALTLFLASAGEDFLMLEDKFKGAALEEDVTWTKTDRQGHKSVQLT